MRLAYLKEQKLTIYTEFLADGKLICHCQEINDSAYEMLETIEKRILKEDGQSGRDNFWENHQRGQYAHDVAEKNVLKDLIYS